MSITDPTKFKLTTRYNIQKKYVDFTTTVNVSGATLTEYTLYTHGLGYIPTARVFYEPVSGQLWPVTREQYATSGGGSGTQLNVTGDIVITSTQIIARLVNAGAAADVTFTGRIYVDE